MILCAGGGYARLAIANEVAGVAPLLTAQGVAVFVLKYRLADYGIRRRCRTCCGRSGSCARARREFGVRPDRIGVFGASAGGHWRRRRRRCSTRRRPDGRAARRDQRPARTSSRCCIP